MSDEKPQLRLKDTDPDLYQMAKTRVLALGYGMGPRGFYELLRKQGVRRPPTWRESLSVNIEPSRNRDALFRALAELERAGVKIQAIGDDLKFIAKTPGAEKKIREFAANAPAVPLRVVEREGGHYELIGETQP